MDSTRIATTPTEPSISPSGLLSDPDRPFLLSSSEWFALQRYVEEALQLPTTEEAMRKSLKLSQSDDLTQFQPIYEAYAKVYEHCNTWKAETFPETVALANDIVHYGNDAPTYYEPILEYANVLKKNPNDSEAKEALTAILNILSQQATEYATRAQEVYVKIEQFANDSGKDKQVLTPLYQQFNSQFGSESEEVQRLVGELAALKNQVDTLNKEYEYDVKVAATSPTYAWVLPPFGLIAAASVAGVYGEKATKTKKKIALALAQIKETNEQLQRATRLMATLHFASQGMNNILQSLSAALPVIQHIQSAWFSIAKDLNHIIEIIDKKIEAAPAVIMNLGVKNAINQWTLTANKANDYVAHAFITTTGSPE